MKTNKIILFMFMLLITIFSASAFTIIDDFSTHPDDNPIWTYQNSSECQRTLINNTLLINASGNADCNYYLNYNLDIEQDISVEWKMNTNSAGITGATEYAHFRLTDEEVGNCSFRVLSYELGGLPDKWLASYHTENGTEYFNQAETFNLNGNWYDFQFLWIAETKTMYYYVNSNLIDTITIDPKNCNNITDMLISFGSGSQSSLRTYTYYDNIIITGNAESEATTCEEPCIFNETFSYSNSICQNGWIAGNCNDLNLPYNGVYICNDSNQVIANYFGLITKDSGIVTISYDLRIDSDYDVIVGVGSEAMINGLYWKYDGGTLYEKRDNTILTTYDYNTTYTYRFDIDLNNYEYDFYIDDVLTQSNIRFYQEIDDLYYLFFQPDYNKGFPYCDYTLDNVVINRGIAEIPTDEGGEIQYFGGFNLNNGSFNTDLCNENENPTFCVLRSSFQQVGGSFADFFFNNFLVFLVLIIVLIVIFIIKKETSQINIFK